MKLKLKYILAFLIIYLLASISLTIYLTNRNQKILIKQANDNFQNLLVVIGRTIASPLVTFRTVKLDEITISETRREILESKKNENKFEDLVDIIIFDKNGLLAFPSKLDQINVYIPSEVLEGASLASSILNKMSGNLNFYSFFYNHNTHNYGILIYKVPFIWGGGVTYQGYVATIISYDRIYREQNWLRISAILINILFLTIAILFIWLMTLILTRRIYILINAVQGLSRGEFIKVKPKGKDELEDLMIEFNKMLDAIKERKILGSYVSETTLEMIKKSASLSEKSTEKVASINIEPSYQEFTIFFSDIRGFTSYSENHSPEQVMRILNEILDYQVGIIKKYEGDIDKFIGDSIMAIFKGEKKEINALKASFEILKNYPFSEIKIGIGICSGRVIVGNIGGSERKEIATIGDIVNTASRLCGIAEKNEMVVSEETYKNAKVSGFEGPEFVSVKGKSKPIPVYRKKV
ncbi:MAG: hypothetical protein N3A58_03665 [Spirochaetes bacterium]|nr:hypothetical protein [Spirochaetota bacterium]